MARWRPMAEDLDPQVKEFTTLLRRQVERSGVSLSALADATGYSRTSWDRYLNGRLLPPRYAVVALAEVTGAEPGHLTTMWELTERAWSRSEGRCDITMEASAVAQARAALGEFGPAPRFADEPPAAGPPHRDAALPDPGKSGPAKRIADKPRTASPRRRRAVLFALGVAAVLLSVLALALHPFRGTGHRAETAGPSAAPSASAAVRHVLGAGREGAGCTGAGCAGKDPEAMGCGGGNATTAAAAWVGGAYVEMRYSAVCGAVWARISAAGPGDSVSVTSAKRTRRSSVGGGATTTYTPMLAATAPGQGKACAELSDGAGGCTPPGTPASPQR